MALKMLRIYENLSKFEIQTDLHSTSQPLVLLQKTKGFLITAQAAKNRRKVN